MPQRSERSSPRRLASSILQKIQIQQNRCQPLDNQASLSAYPFDLQVLIISCCNCECQCECVTALEFESEFQNFVSVSVSFSVSDDDDGSGSGVFYAEML